MIPLDDWPLSFINHNFITHTIILLSPQLIYSPPSIYPVPFVAILYNISNSIHRIFFLLSFTSDFTGELNILGHDGNTLAMDGAQVRILVQFHKVCL